MKTCYLFVAILLAIPRAAPAQGPEDHQTTFFVGRATFDKNTGRHCGDIGRPMATLLSKVSTIPVKSQRIVALKSNAIFETPFLFMNGHDNFVFSSTELANLRVYLEHGGFVFASGCCTNPAFPRAWRREMARLWPGAEVKPLPYDHSIYRAFYRIQRVRNLHENRDIHLECVFWKKRMVAVMCENGLCCAFSMNNRCNAGRGVSPEDGKKLAVNIAVHAMTH